MTWLHTRTLLFFLFRLCAVHCFLSSGCKEINYQSNCFDAGTTKKEEVDLKEAKKVDLKALAGLSLTIQGPRKIENTYKNLSRSSFCWHPSVSGDNGTQFNSVCS